MRLTSDLTDVEIFRCLCVRDPRNPMHGDMYWDEPKPPIPRMGCGCDNCFYGRDELALEILKLWGRIKEMEDRNGKASKG